MQMVVLLNDFEQARQLLDGNDGSTARYGTIHYYQDQEIEAWCEKLKITRTLGMRTFWDLQQNQEIQKDDEWQKQMLDMEMKVSDLEDYKAVAFFHHLLIQKA